MRRKEGRKLKILFFKKLHIFNEKIKQRRFMNDKKKEERKKLKQGIPQIRTPEKKGPDLGGTGN